MGISALLGVIRSRTLSKRCHNSLSALWAFLPGETIEQLVDEYELVTIAFRRYGHFCPYRALTNHREVEDIVTIAFRRYGHFCPKKLEA